MSRRSRSLVALAGLSLVAAVTLTTVVLLDDTDLARSALGPAASAGEDETERASAVTPPVDPARRDLGAESLEWDFELADDGPNAGDELMVLVAFGWSIEDALGAIAARGPRAQAEVLDELLATELEHAGGRRALLLLECLESLGLPGDRAADRLFAWVGRESARTLARRATRVLARHGAHGRELATELARKLWTRAFEPAADRGDELCALQVLGELEGARVRESAPLLRELSERALESADAAARRVAEQLEQRSSDSQRLAATGEDDPLVRDIRGSREWRHRAVQLVEALVAVDSAKQAHWIRSELEAGDAGAEAPSSTAEALVSALEEKLPERPESEVAEALEPYVLRRLREGVEPGDWDAPFVLRAGGLYGPDALPELLELLSQPLEAEADKRVVASVADAASASGDPIALAALRGHLEQQGSSTDVTGELSDASAIALEVLAEHGTPQDHDWLHDRLATAPPVEAVALLEHLSSDAWNGRAGELARLIETAGARLERDPFASVLVDLGLERLVAAVEDPQPYLRSLAASGVRALADRAEGAAFHWRFANTLSAEERIALLSERFMSEPNPFREVASNPSLWKSAVELAKDPQTPVSVVANSLAREEFPLRLRVALTRGLATRSDDAALAVLGEHVPALALACRIDVESDASWSRNVERGHWKSIAWLAVSDELGRAIARDALAHISPRRSQPSGELAEAIELLEDYLDAMARSGWGEADARIFALAERWNRDLEREAVLAELRAACVELPIGYLELLAARRNTPLAVRGVALLALVERVDPPTENVRRLAAAWIDDAPERDEALEPGAGGGEYHAMLREALDEVTRSPTPPPDANRAAEPSAGSRADGRR